MRFLYFCLSKNLWSVKEEARLWNLHEALLHILRLWSPLWEGGRGAKREGFCSARPFSTLLWCWSWGSLGPPAGALFSADFRLLPLCPGPPALLRGRQLLVAPGGRPLPPHAAGAHSAFWKAAVAHIPAGGLGWVMWTPILFFWGLFRSWEPNSAFGQS